MVRRLRVARNVDVLHPRLHALRDAHLDVDRVALHLRFYGVDGEEQVAIVHIERGNILASWVITQALIQRFLTVGATRLDTKYRS